MKKKHDFGKFVCKYRNIILVVCLLLLIPSIIGMEKTKVNYDILVYLPEDIETMKGQQILTDDFDMGAFSISIVDNMNSKDVIKLENKIKDIDGVNKVVSLYDAIGTSIPVDMLPSKVTDKLYKDNSTLLLITFNESTSNEKTLDAVDQIRELTKEQCKIGGLSSTVLDTMNLSNKEVVSYVLIAVVLCAIVLMLALDSYFIPVILLGNIGVAILYNMGSNIMFGEISYITKAISAILQLGVTTDFSIFLYHKYENAKKTSKNNIEAMSSAINETMVSVIGSSFTTIAGFLALCTMELTLGKDIGLVMAKGVLFGLICVITLFPALILLFDKVIDKTRHKPFIPEFKHIKAFTIKHYKLIFAIFLILLIPAWYGQNNTKVYYKLDSSLPASLASSVANSELKSKFNIVSPEVVLIDKNLSNNETNKMIDEIKELDGIDIVVSYSKISDLAIPEDMINEDVKKVFESDKYKMIFINSTYEIASDELNNQISDVNNIIKKYDNNAITAGEGPLMKDLINISNTDFNNVTASSIGVIFIIMLFVLKSASLPVLLVSIIEFAIFANMSVPFYTGKTIPFITSIVIGTIQLGATIDYAILMTTKYIDERKKGKDKMKAIKIALDNSVNSIFVSGLCFFAATFGVGVYSKLEIISSLCTIIARGAIISMIVVITVLPSFLIIFDKLIIKTTLGFKGGKKYEQ